MKSKRTQVTTLCFLACFNFATACFAISAGQQAQASGAPAASVQRVGAIKSVSGTQISLGQDSGADIKVAVQPTTRILRIAPGEKTLKNATPIQVQDLQVGDRILVGGKLGDDGISLAAATVVVMKKSDVEAKHQQDLQDWQKRGVDGPATAVDAAAGTVTIKVRGKDVIIRSAPSTVILRYPPDSWKFETAQVGTLQQIHKDDQVRALGNRNSDGSEVAAEEIVSGSFPIITGTVNSVDASSSTVSVHDLLSKKNVTLKITQESQLHHLPTEMAQMFAMRLKAGGGGAPAGGAPSGAAATNGQNAAANGAPGAAPGGNGGPGGRAGGSPDIQRMLARAPATTLADLKKGDAVMILSTEASGGVGTAITLVSGVEPILQAAPNAGQAMMLAPWSLGAPAGDSGGP